MSWANPYSERNRRATLADVNRERVLRQKKEREFLRGITDKYELTHMDEVEARLEEEQKVKLLDIRAAQHRRSESPVDVPLPPAIATVSRFDEALRCFQPTHGGATIWTGEADGCIGIRNGVDGKLAYRIEKTEGLFVDVLYQSSSSHMWVGLSDGTIRIYDPLVFILLYEAKRHTKAVSCFAETFDGKVFSSSIDGSIVKWDSEAHEFECIMEIPASDSSAVRSIACYGYHLFVANDTPVVRSIDAESGTETRTYESHDGSVAAVAVADGYLWTAGSDSTIGVWNINTGDRLATLAQHQTGVTCLTVDSIGHTVWSSDDSGMLCVWHSKPSHDFAFIRSYVPEGAGAPTRSLMSFVAVDASKIWSLGSNGKNFVWHSATNRVERYAKQAILAMSHIIEQDIKELERWAAVLANLRAVAARMKVNMASQLGESADLVAARSRFFSWVRWAMHRQWKRRWPLAAVSLARAANSNVASRYFHSWARFRDIKHRRKHLEQLAAAAAQQAKNTAVIAYFRKAQYLYRFARQKEMQTIRANVFAAAQERRIRATAFAKFGQYLDQRKRHAKRQQMAAAIARTVDRTLRCGAFTTWMSFAQRRTRGKGAAARAVALGGILQRSLLGRYYFMWLRHCSAGKLAMRRNRAAVVFNRKQGRTVLRSAYWKWRRWVDERATARASEKLHGVREQIAAMQSKLDAVENITGRQRLVTETERLIEIATTRIEAKKQRLSDLRREVEAIQEETALKRSGARETMQKTMSEQVDDLIAMLKAKLLNLHQDYAMTRKILEKTKTVNPAKLFLESHLAVKRLVVDLTGQSMLSAEDVWPLTTAKIRSIPKHHSEAVLTAIKTMIVAFDIMSPEDRSSLQTDNEIAINAHWLGEFADVCLVNRAKALGKAVHRVK